MAATVTSPKLMKYDAARHALAEAHRVDEAKDIRDRALAVAAYARQAQDHDMVRWATEIKLRAERRVGEMLREMGTAKQRQGRGGDRKSKSHSTILIPSLKNLGVTLQQSSDWQQLAALSDAEFEQRVEHAGRSFTTGRDPAAMSTARLLHPLPKVQREDPLAVERIWDRTTGWLRDADNLPSIEGLKGVRPRAGREARAKYFQVAQRYWTGLRRLHKEGYL